MKEHGTCLKLILYSSFQCSYDKNRNKLKKMSLSEGNEGIVS